MADGWRNLITDVPGVLVGCAEDPVVRTGVTVITGTKPFLASGEVRGGGPGTRETALLDPSCAVERIDAIVLSGGSAFGLDAAGAVALQLAKDGRGFPVGGMRVPIVPSAIIFDLLNGGAKTWGDTPPYRQLALSALQSCGADVALGNAGAGYGAMAGLLKGGQGSASSQIDGGVIVGALMIANPVGSVVEAESGAFWAAPFAETGELAGSPLPPHAPSSRLPSDTKLAALAAAAGPAANTTIGVVATNAMISKAEARRIAIMAHDGFARAIRPVHAPMDGDTVFVVSTGRISMQGDRALALSRLGHAAAETVARAIARGVHAAESLGNSKSWRETYGHTG